MGTSAILVQPWRTSKEARTFLLHGLKRGYEVRQRARERVPLCRLLRLQSRRRTLRIELNARGKLRLLCLRLGSWR